MTEAARKRATYEDLYGIPENATGEIIDGELFVTPRPSRKHIYAASALTGKLGPPYQFGEGDGPGGWIILIEPEIAFGKDTLVPGLAGWKRERLPAQEEHNWISVVPDWICEILSPGTSRKDRAVKTVIYARYGVPYLWLIDPLSQTLEELRLLESGHWMVVGIHAQNKKVRAEPFQEMEIELGKLWFE